jgi:hypothetical protein
MGKKTGRCRRGSVSAGRGSGASLEPVWRAAASVRRCGACKAVSQLSRERQRVRFVLKAPPWSPGLTYAGVKVNTTGSVRSTVPASSSRWE